jgi:hypothetical protein
MAKYISDDPKLSLEFHPTRNGFTSDKITLGSNLKVWWSCSIEKECECLHEWESSTHNRNKGSGCPYCSKPPKRFCKHTSLAGKYPEIAEEYAKENLIPVDEIGPKSGKIVRWRCLNNKVCDCPHEYDMSVIARTKAVQGCIYCSKNKVCPHTSLKAAFPEIAKEYYSENDIPVDQIHPGSNDRVWWKCSNKTDCGCSHYWEVGVCHRTGRSRGCPYCSKPAKKCCKHESLEGKFPEKLNIFSQ